MKIRFAMIGARGIDHGAFAELKGLLAHAGLDAEPAFVPTYAAMYGLLQQRVCTLGWSPPLVARDLLRDHQAEPVALVLRNGTQSYYSAIVTKTSSWLWHVGQLERARIGWVSRLSAAGYVVPRAYLATRRVSLSFARETFHETHARAAAALEKDTVDAVATYAIVRDAKTLHVPLVPDFNVLAAAGPIPGELVVAPSGTDSSLVLAARDALSHEAPDPNGRLASLGVTGFAPPPEHHVDVLSQWDGRGVPFTAAWQHPHWLGGDRMAFAHDCG